MSSSRKKQQGKVRKATSPRQNPGLKESKTAKRNRERSAKVESSNVKVIPLPEAGKWTSNDLCNIINLPEAGTPDHRARDDMNYLFSTEDSDLVPYELLQKEELQKQLDLLNEKITSKAYAEWHEQWRIRMKELQDQGGKYTTNLSKTALQPCTGLWLTHYGTSKEKDYECPHEEEECNKNDPASPSMRTLLLDQIKMIVKEATGEWPEDLTIDSPDIAGIKPIDLIPVLCDIRTQDTTVDNLANDCRVTSSRIRTTGVILALSTIVYHYATTGEALPIMYASVLGAEEHMVFGCSSKQAKKKGISCEPFKNCLVVCHGCRPHPENDLQGERNLRNSCYTMEWHEKTGEWIMNFYHAALRGDLQRRLRSLRCTKYLLKRAKLLDKSPEEIAAINVTLNKTLRAGRVAGGEASGEQQTLASRLRKVDSDEEELDEDMQVLLKKLVSKFGKEALDSKMKKRVNYWNLRSLSSAINSGKQLSTEMKKTRAELVDAYGGEKQLEEKVKSIQDGWDTMRDIKAKQGAQQVHQRNVNELGLTEARPEETVIIQQCPNCKKEKKTTHVFIDEDVRKIVLDTCNFSKLKQRCWHVMQVQPGIKPQPPTISRRLVIQRSKAAAAAVVSSDEPSSIGVDTDVDTVVAQRSRVYTSPPLFTVASECVVPEAGMRAVMRFNNGLHYSGTIINIHPVHSIQPNVRRLAVTIWLDDNTMEQYVEYPSVDIRLFRNSSLSIAFDRTLFPLDTQITHSSEGSDGKFEEVGGESSIVIASNSTDINIGGETTQENETTQEIRTYNVGDRVGSSIDESVNENLASSLPVKQQKWFV